MNIGSFIKEIEIAIPLELAESWDNSGFQIGDRKSELKNILFCLDVTTEVVREAKEQDANLIISHHPLIFQPYDNLDFTNGTKQILAELIKNNLAVYSCHTNYDIIKGGVNSQFASRFNCRTISCLDGKLVGLGVFMELESSMSLESITQRLRQIFNTNELRMTTNDLQKKVKRIAFCGGAGKSLVAQAIKLGAELYISSELGHHAALEAKHNGLILLEADHFATEHFALTGLAKIVKQQVGTSNVKLFISEQKALWQHL
ncbi:MAG: Nif3-like dinuclear metal center hexameric protein [Clostridia bacterium]